MCAQNAPHVNSGPNVCFVAPGLHSNAAGVKMLPASIDGNYAFENDVQALLERCADVIATLWQT